MADPNIDIIYVATPHSHHYQNARLCLEAGKNVLCEKSLTVNAAQAEILVKLAKDKNLFFMEAVWTRYFPLSKELREKAKNGEIGKVTRVFADVSFGSDVEGEFGTSHRMVNLDLAGGAMLDRKSETAALFRWVLTSNSKLVSTASPGCFNSCTTYSHSPSGASHRWLLQ